MMASKQPATIPFATGEPIPWRVADAGLCLEGRCVASGRHCAAFPTMVIGNCRMGQFTVSRNSTFSCPSCGGNVRADALAFNRCQWRICDTDVWNEAKGTYQRYNLHALPIAIETRALLYEKTDTTANCTICLAAMSELKKCSILPCRHTYHTECIHEWIDADEETSLQCPMCRREIFK